MGVAGGIIEPEWRDRKPEAWASEFLWALALRNFGDTIQIANKASHPNDYPSFAPIGAGMVTRRTALKQWMTETESGSLAGRQGHDLKCGEDTDMVMSALRAGWSCGYFPNLRLTHLIPARRLEVRYVAALYEAIATSLIEVLGKYGIFSRPPIAPWTVPLRKARAYVRNRAWAGPAEYIRWRGACGQYEGRAMLYRSKRATA